MCRIREWVFNSPITFIKCLGGAPGAEGILIGCEDGMVATVFINNPFPVQLWKHCTSVRKLDLSCERRLLAIVDSNSQLTVANCETAQVCSLCKQSASFVSVLKDSLRSAVTSFVVSLKHQFPHHMLMTHESCVVDCESESYYFFMYGACHLIGFRPSACNASLHLLTLFN
jgi:hypothetical protein